MGERPSAAFNNAVTTGIPTGGVEGTADSDSVHVAAQDQ